MVRYDLYDDYGERVSSVALEVPTCETIIIEYDGRYYQPKCYSLSEDPHVAKCIPITVVHCKKRDTNGKSEARA
jgi:hypothetical protein